MRRRSLLLMAGAGAGGALLLGYALRPPSAAERLGAPDPERLQLNAWLRIGADGSVQIAMPRAEMGQGVHTALAQLLAEELDADWHRVGVVDVPVAQVYANQALLLNVLPLQPHDDGLLARFARGAGQRLGYWLHLQVTGGSSSVRDAWGPLRLAGASARQMLLQAAAQRWQLPRESLRTEAGRVWAGERSIGYGELAAAAAKLDPPTEVALKPRSQWRLIGKPVPRLDLPAKVDGSAVYGIDVTQPGLLHAAIRQSPSFGGSVVALDTAALRAERGVVDAFVLQGHTAVVIADRWWRAEAALKKHPPRFDAGPKAAWNSPLMRTQLRRALDQRDGLAFRDQGDADALLDGGAIRADYELPFLAHATLEPQNATAQFKDGKLTIWAPTQVAAIARFRAAEVAGVDQQAVTLHTTYLGGGFGRRLETDAVEQVVAIALRTGGRPVKLLWNREEDFSQGVLRPMAIARFGARLGPDGLPLAWRNVVAGPSLTLSTVQRLLPALAMDMPDKNHIEGAYDLPYAIPAIEVRQLRVDCGMPVASWRSVGHSINAFATECFLDELAASAGRDPLAYREALLAQRPRHLAVLRRAAQLGNWGAALPPGRARGIALHESFGSICAQVVEASIGDGKVRVHRVSLALDAGSLVNPDTVRAQMEGSVIFALSAALYGEISIEGGAVQQRSFAQQPLLTLAETPAIEVALIESEAEPGGVGEPGVPPLAPALANALSTLTGRRIRQLPIRL